MSKVSSEKASEYSATYYRKNKDRIREERKQRYLSDPDYREDIKRRAAERKEILASKKREHRKKHGLPPPIFSLYRITVNNGREVVVKMYQISHLANIVGRTIQAVRVWEKLGVIPPALYRSHKGTYGNRLYTEFQVNELKKAYSKAIRENGENRVKYEINSTIFPKLAKQLWEDYPQGVDPDDYV